MKQLPVIRIGVAVLLSSMLCNNTCFGFNLGGSISGGFKRATSSVSSATKRVGGAASAATKRAGSTISKTTKRVGGVASSTTKRVGGVASTTTKRLGGVASSTTKKIGGTASNTAKRYGGAIAKNPEIQKMTKGPGTNENTIIRETYQGALSGAATGAAAGSVFPGPGTIVGAESGAVGGAATGFGQGVYDTNKDYFRARDPGRNLPGWAKPNTQIRVGYQTGLKAAAGSLIGDYSTGAAVGTTLGTNALKAAAESGALNVAAHDYTSVTTQARQGAINGATSGARMGSILGPAGTLAGGESGARAGATTAIAKQAYAANKTAITSVDPGNLLPQGARPNTQVRVGYQSALRGSAAAVIGDYSTASNEGKTTLAMSKNVATPVVNKNLRGTVFAPRSVSIQSTRAVGVDLQSSPQSP